jgi:hypothetical protein
MEEEENDNTNRRDLGNDDDLTITNTKIKN